MLNVKKPDCPEVKFGKPLIVEIKKNLGERAESLGRLNEFHMSVVDLYNKFSEIEKNIDELDLDGKNELLKSSISAYEANFKSLKDLCSKMDVNYSDYNLATFSKIIDKKLDLNAGEIEKTFKEDYSLYNIKHRKTVENSKKELELVDSETCVLINSYLDAIQEAVVSHKNAGFESEKMLNLVKEINKELCGNSSSQILKLNLDSEKEKTEDIKCAFGLSLKVTFSDPLAKINSLTEKIIDEENRIRKISEFRDKALESYAVWDRKSVGGEGVSENDVYSEEYRSKHEIIHGPVKIEEILKKGFDVKNLVQYGGEGLAHEYIIVEYGKINQIEGTKMKSDQKTIVSYLKRSLDAGKWQPI